MLFFFEAAFFVLAITAIALGEWLGRGQALGVWAAVTVLSVVANPLVRARAWRGPAVDRREEQWRRTVGDSWRHFNMLLLFGLVALGGWWWLATVDVGR